MNVAVTTSVSSNIAELAMLTVPNKLEYCLRHGYHLVIDNRPYDEAVDTFADTMLALLDQHDLVWALDSDALITNMDVPIHTLPCIGPGMTVCPEGIVEWNFLNCGSTIWKSGYKSRYLLETLRDKRGDWIGMPCQQQSWFGQCAKAGSGDLITVAPFKAFNSTEWNYNDGNFRPGGWWEEGDLVYHPCGVFPHEERLRRIKEMLHLPGPPTANVK
jgi:hypothetical protein